MCRKSIVTRFFAEIKHFSNFYCDLSSVLLKIFLTLALTTIYIFKFYYRIRLADLIIEQHKNTLPLLDNTLFHTVNTIQSQVKHIISAVV